MWRRYAALFALILIRGFGRCDVFVLLLSPFAVRSKWVERELDYALTHKRYDNRILIAELAKASLEDLTWALSTRQITRLHPGLDHRLPLLRRAIRKLTNQDSTRLGAWLPA